MYFLKVYFCDLFLLFFWGGEEKIWLQLVAYFHVYSGHRGGLILKVD